MCLVVCSVSAVSIKHTLIVWSHLQIPDRELIHCWESTEGDNVYTDSKEAKCCWKKLIYVLEAFFNLSLSCQSQRSRMSRCNRSCSHSGYSVQQNFSVVSRWVIARPTQNKKVNMQHGNMFFDATVSRTMSSLWCNCRCYMTQTCLTTTALNGGTHFFCLSGSWSILRRSSFVKKRHLFFTCSHLFKTFSDAIYQNVKKNTPRETRLLPCVHFSHSSLHILDLSHSTTENVAVNRTIQSLRWRSELCRLFSGCQKCRLRLSRENKLDDCKECKEMPL